MFRIMTLSLMLCSLLGSALADQFRTFTSPDGREIVAKVISYDTTRKKLQLERENGKRVWLTPSVFGAADQAYIKAWLDAEDFRSKNGFKISVEKEKEGDLVSYALTLTNRGKSLEELDIEYQYYIFEKGSNGQPDNDRHVGGSLTVESIPEGETIVVKTDPEKLVTHFENVKVYEGPGLSFHFEEQKRREDDIRGMRLRILGPHVGESRVYRELTYPTDLNEKYEWKDHIDPVSVHRRVEHYTDAGKQAYAEAQEAWFDGRAEDALKLLKKTCQFTELNGPRVAAAYIYLYNEKLRDPAAAEKLVMQTNMAIKTEGKAMLAWFYATCADERYWDGERAIDFADDAMRDFIQGRNWTDPSVRPDDDSRYLDIQAAAYARRGNLKKAVQKAEDAVRTAEKYGSSRLEAYKARLELYKEGKAYVEPSAPEITFAPVTHWNPEIRNDN
jgi:hypothetical protein